jgi:hypothetical protein
MAALHKKRREAKEPRAAGINEKPGRRDDADARVLIVAANLAQRHQCIKYIFLYRKRNESEGSWMAGWRDGGMARSGVTVADVPAFGGPAAAMLFECDVPGAT